MITKKLINPESGQPYLTESGVELVENRFEVGDTFIPKFNSILKRKKIVVKKSTGKEVEVVEYSMIATVKNKDDVVYTNMDGGKDMYMILTPAQGQSIEKKLNDGMLINQELFEVRTYISEKYGEQVGLFLKGKSIPPKTFADFEDGEKK